VHRVLALPERMPRDPVCPEHIKIADNGIIPLKERVVSHYYDPITRIGRAINRRRSPVASNLGRIAQGTSVEREDH
jgi:succinate dehydrogenase / fumarate reductase iron-sulfur subunit